MTAADATKSGHIGHLQRASRVGAWTVFNVLGCGVGFGFALFCTAVSQAALR